MKDPADWTWTYLHNELTPKEKALFEQTLQNDPGLRRKLDECRAVHGQLKTLLPLFNNAESDDDQLEKNLLAQWEAEHPEYAEKPATDKPRSKILRFALPLAAAAAAAILFALPAAPIHWQRTVYGAAPQLRGQPAARAQRGDAAAAVLAQKFFHRRAGSRFETQAAGRRHSDQPWLRRNL